MNYKLINESLKDLEELRYNKSKRIKKEIINEVAGDSSTQGEEGLAYEFYEIGLADNFILKMTITTDSYGEDESITGIEFVKPIKKQVTVFEAI